MRLLAFGVNADLGQIVHLFARTTFVSVVPKLGTLSGFELFLRITEESPQCLKTIQFDLILNDGQC